MDAAISYRSPDLHSPQFFHGRERSSNYLHATIVIIHHESFCFRQSLTQYSTLSLSSMAHITSYSSTPHLRMTWLRSRAFFCPNLCSHLYRWQRTSCIQNCYYEHASSRNSRLHRRSGRPGARLFRRFGIKFQYSKFGLIGFWVIILFPQARYALIRVYAEDTGAVPKLLGTFNWTKA